MFTNLSWNFSEHKCLFVKMEDLGVFWVRVRKEITFQTQIFYIEIVLLVNPQHQSLGFNWPQLYTLPLWIQHQYQITFLFHRRVEWERRNMTKFSTVLLLNWIFTKLFGQDTILHLVNTNICRLTSWNHFVGAYQY